MVPIQHAIYGNLQSGSLNYFADDALATVINGFFTGTRTDQFGQIDVTGNFFEQLQPNIDGCEPNPLPTDELSIEDDNLIVQNSDVLLYPNPTELNGEIYIEVSAQSVARVVDVQGRDVFKWDLIQGINQKSFELPSGIYYVNILSQSQNNTIKWIVQ